MQGVELDDFVSGPRELLLKLVEEHYPLPPEPDHAGGWHFSLVISVEKLICFIILYSLVEQENGCLEC